MQDLHLECPESERPGTLLEAAMQFRRSIALSELVQFAFGFVILPHGLIDPELGVADCKGSFGNHVLCLGLAGPLQAIVTARLAGDDASTGNVFDGPPLGFFYGGYCGVRTGSIP